MELIKFIVMRFKYKKLTDENPSLPFQINNNAVEGTMLTSLVKQLFRSKKDLVYLINVEYVCCKCSRRDSSQVEFT